MISFTGNILSKYLINQAGISILILIIISSNEWPVDVLKTVKVSSFANTDLY